MQLIDRLPRYQVKLVREKADTAWEPVAIRFPGDIVNLLSPWYETMDREAFVTLALDTKHRVIGMNIVSIGDLSGTLVHPRELFKAIILANASAVVLSHNHPSGDPEPSPEDLDLTARLSAAGKLLGIEVLDHVIIGDNRYVSLKERGLMGGAV